MCVLYQTCLQCGYNVGHWYGFNFNILVFFLNNFKTFNSIWNCVTVIQNYDDNTMKYRKTCMNHLCQMLTVYHQKQLNIFLLTYDRHVISLARIEKCNKWVGVWTTNIYLVYNQMKRGSAGCEMTTQWERTKCSGLWPPSLCPPNHERPDEPHCVTCDVMYMV